MQNPNQHEILPLRLYSALQRQLAATGQTKGTPQQWIGTIRNLQKKGVSAVEIKWSNIIPVLEECSDRLLHIDELLAFLEDKPPCELVLQRCITQEYAPRVRYEKQQRPAKLPPITVHPGRREMRLLHFEVSWKKWSLTFLCFCEKLEMSDKMARIPRGFVAENSRVSGLIN